MQLGLKWGLGLWARRGHGGGWANVREGSNAGMSLGALICGLLSAYYSSTICNALP